MRGNAALPEECEDISRRVKHMQIPLLSFVPPKKKKTQHLHLHQNPRKRSLSPKQLYTCPDFQKAGTNTTARHSPFPHARPFHTHVHSTHSVYAPRSSSNSSTPTHNSAAPLPDSPTRSGTHTHRCACGRPAACRRARCETASSGGTLDRRCASSRSCSDACLSALVADCAARGSRW